jgi:hypothetical protein
MQIPPASVQYRLDQANLIRAGRYLDAMKLDVDDIRAQFPGKYEEAIHKMGEFVWRAWE